MGKSNEKRAWQKSYQRKTLTCHQRLKLSFTTHLFFTVLTWFSFVICQNAENQTHLNIFAEKKTIGRTRNAKIIEMVLSLINHVLHIDQIWCLLEEPGVPQGIVLAPLDFPIQGQLLYQSQLAASSALAWEILDHYKFYNTSVMCQNPRGELVSIQVFRPKRGPFLQSFFFTAPAPKICKFQLVSKF